MSEPKNVIKLGKPELLGDTSHEIARLWVTHNGPSTAYINSYVMPDPSLYGMLLADAAHHGARAYAKMHGSTVEEALARIWEGLDAERESSGTFEAIDTSEESN